MEKGKVKHRCTMRVSQASSNPRTRFQTIIRQQLMEAMRASRMISVRVFSAVWHFWCSRLPDKNRPLNTQKALAKGEDITKLDLPVHTISCQSTLNHLERAVTVFPTFGKLDILIGIYPQEPSIPDDRVGCFKCQRKFSEAAHERHVKVCKGSKRK